MKSRWLGVALLAAGLGVGTANGQQGAYVPTPVGAARLPEPFPISQPLPQMTPGPLNSYTAPPGPPNSLSLPAGHSSAFQEEEFVPERAFYFHVGAIGLSRQGFGNRFIGLQDPQNLDTGITPLIATPLINLSDVHGHVQFGTTATVGFLWENRAIEATAWWIFTGNATNTTNFPGQIDLPFTNPPLGFEGNNNLWLQADQVTIQRKTTLGNGEINFRYSNLAVTEAELIIGVRYLDLKERLDIVTSDDGIAFPNILGQSDARRDAVYQVETHNRLVTTQMGFEYGKLVTRSISMGVSAKGAFGVNLSNTHHRLFRGDSFFGFDSDTNSISYKAQIYDASAFVEFHLTEKCRLKAAYNVLWLTGIKVTEDQIDFNLRNRQGMENENGSAYFHGPTLEFQFLY